MLASLSSITLTTDQQNALGAFQDFLLNPEESVFVLRGYSGCGKSTLVRVLLNQLDNFNTMARMINPAHIEYTVALTATTNKAAENLRLITNEHTSTIHSFFGLRVVHDPVDKQSKLSTSRAVIKQGYLLFIDEASYIDSYLLDLIFKLTHNCKIVFIGDPAQLIPVKARNATVFTSNFKGAALTEVVRQTEGNPIVDLSSRFRETVCGAEFFSFKPDGNHIQHLSREDFDTAVLTEFARPDWQFNQSKILAWTNKKVVAYNEFVSLHVKGDPHFQVGDFVVCNQYVQGGALKARPIRTDDIVAVTKIQPDCLEHGVLGNWVTVDNRVTAFQPKSLLAKKARAKKARAESQFALASTIENQWFDLRAAYACTVNKAQGSTFDRVFIDLNDIARCNNTDQLARMLYVAVSRARHQVFLTGDLV
jgi:energy-coupling factor transporter ATP-binding protein EcfA2